MKKIWFVSIGLLLSTYLIWSGCAGKSAEKDPALVKRPALSKKPEKPPWKPMYLSKCPSQDTEAVSYCLKEDLSFAPEGDSGWNFKPPTNYIDACLFKKDEIISTIRKNKTDYLTIELCRETDWIFTAEFIKIVQSLNHLAFTKIIMKKDFIDKFSVFFKISGLSLHLSFSDDGSPDFYKNLNVLMNMKNIYGIRFYTSRSNLKKQNEWVLPENIKYFGLENGHWESLQYKSTFEWLSKQTSIEMLLFSVGHPLAEQPEYEQQDLSSLKFLKKLNYFKIDGFKPFDKSKVYSKKNLHSISTQKFWVSNNLTEFNSIPNPQVEHLILENVDCSKVKSPLKKFKKLKYLEFRNLESSIRCAEVVAHFRALKAIYIDSNGITGGDIETIIKSPSLESITILGRSKIDKVKVSSKSLKTINFYTEVKTLVLDLNTEKSVSLHLNFCPTLLFLEPTAKNRIRYLSIVDGEYTKNFENFFNSLRELEMLDLGFKDFPAVFVEKIFSLQSVKKLRLYSHDDYIDQKISCRNIEDLSIDTIKISDNFLNSLTNCIHVKKLTFDKITFDNQSIQIIKKFKKIQSLRIFLHENTDSLNLEPNFFNNFSLLRDLVLYRFIIQDASLIMNLPNITWLKLERTEIPFKEVLRLEKFKNLNFFNLIWAFEEEEEKYLENAFKNIIFQFSHPNLMKFR